MKTKKITLSDGTEVILRRPGRRAKLRIEQGVQVPAGALGTALKQYDIDLQSGDGAADAINKMAAEKPELLPELHAWLERVQLAGLEGTCACIAKPKVTPDTIDEYFDDDQVDEIDREIAEHKAEVDGDLERPTSAEGEQKTTAS